MNDYGVVLFPNITSALRAEKVLMQAGYKIKLIPNPRQLANCCGLALRYAWHQTTEINQLLEQSEIDIVGIHQIE
jgi:Fe-S oxidoreductase